MFLFSVEISHQLNNSNAQVLFALASASSTIQEAIELCKRPIKVVYVKEKEAESLPVGGIDFNELISLDGEKNLSWSSSLAQIFSIFKALT